MIVGRPDSRVHNLPRMPLLCGDNPITNRNYAFYAGADLSQSNNFETGLQPGDLTKYMSVPWQADFNECSTQPIDVTIRFIRRVITTS